MPTRLVQCVFDAADPAGLAAFWAAALGWELQAEDKGEYAVAPAGFDYPGTGALPLVIVPVPEPKAGKNRLHLDLAATSASHQETEVARLRELGATLADIGQGAQPWVVLADPEGNEFCVLDPRPEYTGTGPVAAVVIDCRDPAALARFWAAAAGWAVQRQHPDLVSLRSASGEGPYLELLRVPGAKTVKDRVHLDVAPRPGDDPAAEVARLRRLGAVPADVGQGRVTWTVLADPEGNEFCVLSPH
jgi:predicted enzyme related to lactoylglutathione lyase